MISSGIMDDVNFKQSMIFIAEHNENGALAFVVNKMAERPLHALVEFGNSPLFHLYNGGPVHIGHLFFIHRRKDLIAGGTHIIGWQF